MNVLFTTSAAPKISPFFTDEKRPPLGLGSLMSVVRNEGYNVFFVDNYLQPTNFIKEGYLQKNKIDYVGIYANTICYRDTLKMFNEIEDLRKKGIWNGKIVVGGPHTSVALDTIPDFVDYVVQGEGERAILKILNGEAEGRIIREERIKDLDSLPFQPWSIFAKLPYDYSCLWMDTKPVFTMNTSRGCPFECAFCSVDSIWGKKYTDFSADRIINEIEYLVKNFGAKGIYFREDNFTLNRKRVEEFCTKLTNKKLSIKWACETRVDTLCDEELVKIMSDAGCEAVYLGVESGSQRILDILKKHITVEQIERCITLCKKHNIRTYCSLITGVPGETYDDYLLTKNLMKKLKPYAYTFSIFVGIPHSELYKKVLDQKLYEHIDDIGLLYLPGYDAKTKYFYGKDSKQFVDYEFKQRTDFDEELLKELDKNKVKRSLRRVVFFLPSSILKKIGKQNEAKKLYKRIVNR
ncbi:MAG TPA: B12-binding domain-containing radical SAM protein [Candidatus Woesearchaeota archaeon]|nr:B12-binding domain-containing radical SAM protein [Candidatus Woesearchaeota archaeon]